MLMRNALSTPTAEVLLSNTNKRRTPKMAYGKATLNTPVRTHLI